MGHSFLANSRTRKLAFSVVASLFVGNLLAESGDITALVFHLPQAEGIILNFWLAVGIASIFSVSFPLFRRRSD